MRSKFLFTLDLGKGLSVLLYPFDLYIMDLVSLVLRRKANPIRVSSIKRKSQPSLSHRFRSGSATSLFLNHQDVVIIGTSIARTCSHQASSATLLLHYWLASTRNLRISYCGPLSSRQSSLGGQVAQRQTEFEN